VGSRTDEKVVTRLEEWRKRKLGPQALSVGSWREAAKGQRGGQTADPRSHGRISLFEHDVRLPVSPSKIAPDYASSTRPISTARSRFWKMAIAVRMRIKPSFL
jgi:hypothetical protein